MAVRRIGVNARSTTGRHGYSRQQYESTLERDLLDLLAFDYNVDRYETQPLVIEYFGSDGKLHRYTPDVLVFYRRDVVPAKDMPHLLVEVKYRQEYRGQFKELKQRFRAARLYCRERGWRFVVLTEREIRTPYLSNARFLRAYRDMSFDPGLEWAVLDQTRTLGQTTPSMLIESLADSELMRATYLREMWRLVATKRIGTDLTLPLSMDSAIWYNG
jgi:hypothetical protein